jgi:hypothetical protein
MSNLEQLIECCNNVIQAMEQDRLGKSDYKQGYINAMQLVIRKAKQLQKEEPKTYTPLEAANEYHKEKGVIQPNNEYSWYVIAVNDYLKRTKTYTQEEYNKGCYEAYNRAISTYGVLNVTRNK